MPARWLRRARIVERLALAAEYRDDDTGQHTYRVGHTAALLADVMGMGARKVELLRRAAPLHDVGKIGVPDSILHKPTRLDGAEMERMRRHKTIGAKVVLGGSSPLMRMAEEVAVAHHERWDGGGYPRGLRGEEIPIEGRIVAVADVFDALTHERPYKAAWTVEDAVAEIRRQRGTQFDPRVVDAFEALMSRDASRVTSDSELARPARPALAPLTVAHSSVMVDAPPPPPASRDAILVV